MMARLPRWLWVAGGVAILIGALALVIFLRGGFQTPQPAKLSLNSTNPQALLQEADYLAYLGNWEKACPYFAKAQRLFSAQGDQRDALYCRISCVEADVEKGSYTAAASYLSQELHDSLVRNDARLKLRCLTVKGIVDLNTNTIDAQRDWTEALTLAKSLHDAVWETRATGWLGMLDSWKGTPSEPEQRSSGRSPSPCGTTISVRRLCSSLTWLTASPKMGCQAEGWKPPTVHWLWLRPIRMRRIPTAHTFQRSVHLPLCTDMTTHDHSLQRFLHTHGAKTFWAPRRTCSGRRAISSSTLVITRLPCNISGRPTLWRVRLSCHESLGNRCFA